MIAKLICFFKGHRRGKRVSATHVQCPRCGAKRERAEKAKKVQA